MTRRLARISRRAGTGPLSVFHEAPAAGYLRPWLRLPAMSTRRFWQGIGHTHGDQITAKLRQACPGCRPGYQYGAGLLPALPLLEQPPPEHSAAGEYLDIDGDRYWYCRSSGHDRPWLPCQAEHLRALGEVDGREWRDYLRWRDEGFPSRYQLGGGNRTITILHHLCH